MYHSLHLPEIKFYQGSRFLLAEKYSKVKGKDFPLPSVGPGADPGVQAVSPQVT